MERDLQEYFEETYGPQQLGIRNLLNRGEILSGRWWTSHVSRRTRYWDRLMSDDKPWTTRGLDILLSEIIKGFRKKHTGYTIRVINGCLKGGVFPERFMEAVLILIDKSANQLNTGMKYRPICFINVLGKSPRRARCEKVEETLVDIISSSMGLGAVDPSRCGATQRNT